MQAAIRGLANGDLDVTRRVLSTREGSVWAGSGESQAPEAAKLLTVAERHRTRYRSYAVVASRNTSAS